MTRSYVPKLAEVLPGAKVGALPPDRDQDPRRRAIRARGGHPSCPITRTLPDAQRRQDRIPITKSLRCCSKAGGALGSYQAGVYEGLAQAGIQPNWVAGISIRRAQLRRDRRQSA